MYCQGTSDSRYIQFLNQLIERAKSDDTVVNTRRQETTQLRDDLTVLHIVKPTYAR